MNGRMLTTLGLAAILLAAGGARADVFNLGPGLTSLETVPVGDLGNVGEWCGRSHEGYGDNRICGAVAYTYNIGKYEVTAGQYTAFLNAVAKTDTHGLYATRMDGEPIGCQITRHGSSGNYTYDFSSRPSGTEADWANRPVNYVSWGDAARFANWLHNGQPTGDQGLTTTEDGAYYLNGATTAAQLQAVNRESDWKWAVPSEDEWYKAAYYKRGGTNVGYWDYPTQSDTIPSNVGADGYADPGNHVNSYINNEVYTIGSPYYRTNVGEFENSASPYGTFDQGGNVWEWNEALDDETDRLLRGGSFNSYVLKLTANYRNQSYYPTSEYSNVGFRIVQVPEPASMAVLALGGVGLLRRRRGLGR